MLRSFSKKRPAVALFLATPEGENFSFENLEWKIIDQALQVLEPMYDVTVEISGEKYVSGSKVIPLTKILLAGYVRMLRQYGHPTDIPPVALEFRHTFANAVHQGLLHHLERVEDVDQLALATLLGSKNI